MAKKRKNRRIKKTKYLSLRLQFSSEKQTRNSNDDPIPTTSGHLQQLDLLSNDHGHDDSMEYLLSASDGGATTLTGLLDSAGAVDEDEADELSASASVTYASEAMKLVRTALRSKERESSSEERYVRYSEVVDDQRRDHNHEHEEVSSRVGVGGGEWYNNNNKKNEKTSTVVMRRLCLKLDYQEILNAWSDKGDLYIHSDFPQTVPDIIDITHHFSSHHPIDDPIPNGGGLWNVPEEIGGSKLFKTEEEEEIAVPLFGGKVRVGDDEDHRPEERKCQRKASVLRYKEKRRNRLFSKTIRYQVRKENAQKRPRVKGRFVKRS